MNPNAALPLAIIAHRLLDLALQLSEHPAGVRTGCGVPPGSRAEEEKGPGLVLIFWPIDKIVKVSLRVVTWDVPPQDVITRDNVSLKVNAVVYFRVVSATKAIIEVENFRYAVEQAAQTGLRTVLGEVELDDLLAQREKLNVRLQTILDEQTEVWGVKVTQVQVKQVDLPQEMQRAIAAQAEAERERRAKIIAAEGEFQAAAKLAEAAAVLNREPVAITLRYLQTLIEIGTEKNTTIVFPLPLDLLGGLGKLGASVHRDPRPDYLDDRRGEVSRMTDQDQLCINAIRMLSIDAVQKANSGHPGMPMGAATMAYILWTRHLRHNPKNPAWPDRDRFVLSAGHASALLYSLLFLTGYDLTMEDLEQFRQWGSRTPGHPERGCTPGVEVTTGPLGQGFGNSVGMAIAERWLATTFNRHGDDVVDHYTYVLASDGDLMEGVAAEAASLAGTLRLGRLIVLYDANLITLSATTNLTFSEDVGARFEAYGWHVQRIDGQDLAAVDAALTAARAVEDRPSLIVARTHIGYGSPHKQDTWHAHGEPLGVEEVRLTKRALGWPEDRRFYVPEDALARVSQRPSSAGAELEAAWRRPRGRVRDRAS